MAHLLAVLAPLTGLQELSMCGVMATSQVHGNHKDSLLVMLHTSILQRMQDLTQLHLSTDYGPGTELLQHVGSMTDLRDLRVGGCNSGLIQRGPLQLAVSHLTTRSQSCSGWACGACGLPTARPQQRPQQMLLRCWPGCLASKR
jgi:hypothetical protein